VSFLPRGLAAARVLAARASLAAVSVQLLVGCGRHPDHQITIVDGATVTRFTIQSALAEYVELPGDHNELRLTLAGYPLSCERWLPPAEGQSVITVVVTTPPDVRPSAATYPWSGLPPRGEPIREAYALPKALSGRTSRAFEPGGTLRLTAVALEPHGAVSGTLAFEFPGVDARPATRVDGSFEAKTCRLAFATR